MADAGIEFELCSERSNSLLLSAVERDEILSIIRPNSVRRRKPGRCEPSALCRLMRSAAVCVRLMVGAEPWATSTISTSSLDENAKDILLFFVCS